MSDEEEQYTDEEVEEVDEEEVEADYAPSETDTTRSDRPKTKSFTEDEEGLTEGERAMAAAKRRHEEEQHAKLQDYEERRRTEREKEEEELKKLKEKQEKRKLEREQEEKEMEERRRAADDRRRQEEEERKAKVDQDRRNREEEKNKKNQLSGFQTGGQGGRNFTVAKKAAQNDKFGNIVQAKQEMGMTKEQQEDAKRAFLAAIRKEIPNASEVPQSELKAKIKELHQRICKLETEKYDLEKRHERQEYDPKQLIASKFERQRVQTFSDRRALFTNTKKLDTDAYFDWLNSFNYIAPQSLNIISARDDIHAYLNSPDRCPKYIEKEPTICTSQPVFTPRRLSIPAAFLKQG
eukprot:NP_509337.2 TropoNin T [Caenorhabditis elegans]